MIEGIYLLLGSNLGDKKKKLQEARAQIAAAIGPVVKTSAIYETDAWGKTDQPSFYNQVVQVRSVLSPEELLQRINTIESTLGRIRKEKWGARIIDIDILYYAQMIVASPGLQIPHPGIPHRRFTLVPLVEIAPDYIHPALKKSNLNLLHECSDNLDVKIVA